MASSPASSPPANPTSNPKPPDDDSTPPPNNSSSLPPPKVSPPPTPLPSQPPPQQKAAAQPAPSDDSNTPRSPAPPLKPPSAPSESSDSSPALSNVTLPSPPPSKHTPPSHSIPAKPIKSPPTAQTDQTTGQLLAPVQGQSDVNVPLVVGVTAGVGLFFVMLLVVFLCFTRKKKRPQDGMNYYTDPSRGGSRSHKGAPNYYNGGPPQAWHNGAPMGAPPPGAMGGGSWHSPPPPPQLASSGDMSSGYSGPQGQPMQPPPSPNIALGFNKSTFSYDELAAATNGFSHANILGQGGFGYVHKGLLPNGKDIAVKSLKAGSGQGEREFQAEVEIISRVHHRHLVSLVGYCIAGGQRMLVYEFVPNNTLEFHLHGKDRPTMDFPTRLKIALGSAKGLAYLHEDCHPRIIHRDIKAANILLDYKFEAMVADFGLAKLSSDNFTHVSTRVMGTFGYLAPEYASSGKLTEKSDVFSFGVMLLELITGRRPVDSTHGMMEDSLVDWARPLLTRALTDKNFNDLVDPQLENSYNPGEMARLVACAAASVRHSAKRRPKMSQIVRALEGDSSLEDLNEGVKPGHSAVFGSAGSSEYDSDSYKTQMRKFKKVALASEEFGSSEYGATSEYGLDPSPSSSEAGNSREMETH